MRPITRALCASTALIALSPVAAADFSDGFSTKSADTIDVGFIAPATPQTNIKVTLRHMIGNQPNNLSPPICFTDEGGYADVANSAGQHVYDVNCNYQSVGLVSIPDETNPDLHHYGYAFRKLQQQNYVIDFYQYEGTTLIDQWQTTQSITSSDVTNVYYTNYSNLPDTDLPPESGLNSTMSMSSTDSVITTNPTLEYVDITARTELGDAVLELSRRGVVNGVAVGEQRYFYPHNYVNRVELLKMVLLSRYGEDLPSARIALLYSDIERHAWYEKYITVATQLGIVHGYGDGRFGPNNRIESAQFLKIMAETFDLKPRPTSIYADIRPGSWESEYVGLNTDYNLGLQASSTRFEPYRPLTRGEIAIILVRLLEALEQ